MNQSQIRNFVIIAHIDHGKSTLADRLMELTGTVEKREMQEQLLDSNPIERERGITIKLAPVRMIYKNPPNSEFILNLIDTPGHVDFNYEVSRSLAACEGALLVVDATQGVQAQTLANLEQARQHNLKIIPLINKIDLPNARIAETREALIGLGFSEDEIIEISAKLGTNVNKVLEAIVQQIPPPSGNPSTPFRALIFSSQYDPHKGVVCFVRVVDGTISLRKDFFRPLEKKSFLHVMQSTQLKFIASGAEVTPIEIGCFNPKMVPATGLSAGEVGYIATGLKDIRFAKVGDTITKVNSLRDVTDPLPGYREPKPMVFLGLFPINSAEINEAREAVERLRLSDSAFTFRPISSAALGNGFHCGFLGLLHAEIVQERLLREFGLSMIATSPSVEYQLRLKNAAPFSKEPVSIQSAVEFPDPSLIEEAREPVMQVTIYSPKRYVGAMMQLSQEKRGQFVDLKYENLSLRKHFFRPLAPSSLNDVRHQSQPNATSIFPDELQVAEKNVSSASHSDDDDLTMVELTYLLPLAEMIVDFFDRLKSFTEGYGSLDYEFYEYQPVELVKLDILVNHEKVDALALLVVEAGAQRRGREIVERLATAIPRQQFNIPIQAAIGSKVIARADVKPFRKDVIQKLYGGDRTRKDKLLEAQKKGKARMKMVGKVEIPQSAFFQVLKRN